MSKVFPPFSYGGTESYTAELARELAAKDTVDLHVICFSQGPTRKEELVKARETAAREGYTVHLAGSFFKEFKGLASFTNYKKTYTSISRLLDELQPDILQTLGVYSETLLAIRAAGKRTIPVVVFPRGSELTGLKGRLLPFIHRKFVFAKAAHIFCQTPEARDLLFQKDLQRKAERSQKITIIPNAIRLQDWSPAAKVGKEQDSLEESDSFIFLWVGRFEEVKDPLAALAIFTTFREALERTKEGKGPEPNLVMVGDGSLSPAVREACQGRKDIHLRGRLPREELAPLMNQASVLLNTSRSEGFPMSFLEAMASGLPVVCFNVSGNSGIIQNGKTGFVVEKGDRKIFTEKLVKLYLDPQLREKMKVSCLQAAGTYSWERILENMMAVYRKLVKKDGES